MSFWIRACFFASGAAALLYQMLWFRMLGHVLGTSIQALGIVTATFMAGLALGGFLFGPIADRAKRPLLLYAVIEIAIALIGGAVVWNGKRIAVLVAELGVALGASSDGIVGGGGVGGIGGVGGVAGAGGFDESYALRVVVASLILLVPCTLIGATLPVMIRAVVRSIPDLGEGVGTLYFANTLGAAVGVLGSGLILFETIGLRATALVAIALNVVVAVASILLEPRLSVLPPVDAPVVRTPSRWRRLGVIAFFLSGFSGLALEVLWSRVLFGFVAAGALSFHVMLATLLIGLALGGVVGARWADKTQAPLAAAGMVFAAVGALVLVGLEQIEALQLLGPVRLSASHLALAQIVGMVLPAAIAMGVLFPLIVKGLLLDLGRLGKDAGRYYAVNTLGTVSGALVASFVAIPALGVSQSLVSIALANVAIGLTLVVVGVLLFVPPEGRGRAARLPLLATIVIALGSVAYAPSAWSAFHTSIQQQATREYPAWSEEVAYIEGSESTVAMYRSATVDDDGAAGDSYRIVVNAFPMVALSTRETKLMAHIPMLAAPDPLRTLVICFGLGNTYRSALSHGGRVDVVDINQHIPLLTPIHRGANDQTLNQAHGRIFINDGRNHLLMSGEPYDVITVDPAPPIWSMGMQNLYSRDFFELARDRLSERGIMMQWTPSDDIDDFVSILRAFMDVFPYVEVFQGMDYDDAHYLLGSRSPIVYDEAVVQARLAKPAVAADVAELDPANAGMAHVLRSLYRINGAGLQERVASVAPLTDDRPTLEFRLLRGQRPASQGWFNVPESRRGELPWRSGTAP